MANRDQQVKNVEKIKNSFYKITRDILFISKDKYNQRLNKNK